MGNVQAERFWLLVGLNGFRFSLPVGLIQVLSYRYCGKSDLDTLVG